VSGARPDARSDVYSLASTLFELVAATPPFVRPDDESMVPILARIARDPVPQLPETQLPAPVYEVIQRAMAKDPDDRPDTAVELGTLLAAAQQRLGIAPTTIPIEASGPEGESGRSGYIPFPDSPSGPLPAPTTRSPHETGPPTTSPQTSGDPLASPGATGQTAPPTVVTSPSESGQYMPSVSQPHDAPAAPAASISQETIVSGHHDPRSWAPPNVSGDVAPGSGSGSGASAGAGAGSADGGSGLPSWLIPAAIVAVLLLAAGGAFLALGGDDDDAGDDDAAGGTETTVADTETDETDDGTDDGESDDPTGESIPGQGPNDYEFYETISDDTGSITINVPSEWTDRNPAVGTNGNPQLVAAPLIEGGFIGTYDEPGVQITVAALAEDVEIDIDSALDVVLDNFEEPDCTSVNRTDIVFPFPGRVERFIDCDGGDTKIFHIAYIDDSEGLTAILRIQVVSARDDVAVETIRSSLELEDNVPE
ncbi:MAG: hypothetical protein ACR2QO_17240, partial [Acidimicrobiales bacterium]